MRAVVAAEKKRTERTKRMKVLGRKKGTSGRMRVHPTRARLTKMSLWSAEGPVTKNPRTTAGFDQPH